MKRSKIFLGMTAGLLAIVAFVSAKAKFIVQPVCYKSGTTILQDQRAWGASTIANGQQLFTVVNSRSYLLFTYNNPGVCDVPVYVEE